MSALVNCEVCRGKNYKIENGHPALCICEQERVLKYRLGLFYVHPDKWVPNSRLIHTLKNNLSCRIMCAGRFEHFVKPRVSAILQSCNELGWRWFHIDGSRLADIEMGKDPDYSSGTVFKQYCHKLKLLLVMVGFADQKNRLNTEFVLRLLQYCRLHKIPTWVLLNCTLQEVTFDHSKDLKDFLETLPCVMQ